jgi:hypothetical protein
MPWDAMLHVARVLLFGAKKYGAGNWKMVPKARDRYFAACLRHTLAWWQGEKLDPESGLPHLAHAVTCLIFLLWFDDNRTLDKP